MIAGTSVIEIKAPRWRDRTILVAPWKVGYQNEIRITAKHKDGSLYYPKPLYAYGTDIGKCPQTTIKTRAGGTVQMFVVKLDDVLEQAPWLEVKQETGTTPIIENKQQLPGVSVEPKKNQPLPGQMKFTW